MGNFTKKPIKSYKYNNTIVREYKDSRISDKIRLYIVVFIISLIVIVGVTNASYNSNKEEVKKYSSIQEILNLDGCRITQDEESHLIKGNGSMYAVDISCREAVKIFAPKDKKFYRVKTVSFDDKIGDYVILKHGDYEYVFGHTKSELKKGDRVEAEQEIGVTNLSGKNDGGYHLHFELWKYGYNISYRHLLGESEKYNMEKTYALRKQRGWYLGEKEAMDFIADFEDFRAKPYVDGKGRLSIGYGTKAKSSSDYVTKEEARQRKMHVVEGLMESVYKNHFVKSHNQRIALVSATYNLGINSSVTKVKYRTTEKGIKAWFGRFVKGSVCGKDGCETKKLKGLVNRRSIEANLYLKK